MDLQSQLEHALWRACDDLLFHHTNPWELDEALVSFGFGTGPCELMDHIGLLAIVSGGGQFESPVLPRMTSEGRIGKIGGVGFYRYPGGGGAVIDPLIEDLILEEAHFARVTRQAMSDAGLVDCIVKSLAKVPTSAGENAQARNILTGRLTYPADKLHLLGL